MQFENQNIEFKQEYVPDIKKEVLAFINADGGTILIGIRNDGDVLGVDDPDEVMLQTANALKDSLIPDVMPFVSIHTDTIDGKNVVRIDISTGTNRPYYLRDKGLRAGGVYIRKGSSSQPMTDEGIREMIRATSGNSFEEMRSLNQLLTFETFTAEMGKKNIDSGREKLRTLKMIGEDGLYTNLALLLSDQCPSTIKVAVFQGRNKALFRDRKEFSGSLLKQLEDVYQFIDLNNRTQATFSGLERTDIRDYPEAAVRESLLNCIVHRDYSFSGSTLINIYDDRMEYVSLGGLIPSLELASIFLGVSESRNPNLAAVFYRMHLIESYGTGISKIQGEYEDCSVKPEFETAKGVFRVTLPNRNFETGIVAERRILYASHSGSAQSNEKQRTEQEAILNYVTKHGQISRKEAEGLLSLGTTRAYQLLNELCDRQKLQPVGNGKTRRYIAFKNN
jgi:ATP-dependent DNA helicase RecG